MEKWCSSEIKIDTMLNKATGNIQKFAILTWNPNKGICHHGCKCCYMQPTSEQT